MTEEQIANLKEILASNKYMMPSLQKLELLSMIGAGANGVVFKGEVEGYGPVSVAF